MKIFLLTIMLCVFTNSYALEKCDYSFKKYCAKLDFSKKPSRSYSSYFKLFFIDKKTKNKVIPSESVSAYLWMKMDSGHEHGSDKVKISKMKDHYLIKNVWFVMIGSWQLFVELDKDKKTTEKLVKNIVIGR